MRTGPQFQTDLLGVDTEHDSQTACKLRQGPLCLDLSFQSINNKNSSVELGEGTLKSIDSRGFGAVAVAHPTPGRGGSDSLCIFHPLPSGPNCGFTLVFPTEKNLEFHMNCWHLCRCHLQKYVGVKRCVCVCVCVCVCETRERERLRLTPLAGKHLE